MQLDFDGFSIVYDESQKRREAALDRLRAAVDAMERENRDLQSGAVEFQDTLGVLRSELEDLTGSTDDFSLTLAAINTDPLRRTVQRLGEIADGWLENDGQLSLPLPNPGTKTAA